MTGTKETTFIGTGIYSVSESARLTNVSATRIRRWLRGYSFKNNEELLTSQPVWKPTLPEIDGKLALSFLDLVEVRFVNAFRKEGVSWSTLRKAAISASELTGSTHPFATSRFKTDGRDIFAEIKDETGATSLIELIKSQHYFQKIINPYLKDLEFEHGEPARWWPLGIQRRQIVIDPSRSFGQPIVNKRGIPTAVLAQAVKTNDSIPEVAQWFETDIKSVKAAVLFEKQLLGNKIAA